MPPEVSLTHSLSTQSYSYLVTGWINELTPGSGRIRLHAPIVGSQEHPVIGQVRYEIITGSAGNDDNIAGANHLVYTPTIVGMSDTTLTLRTNQSDPRTPVPRSDFSLTVDEAPDSNQPLVTMNVNGGLQPGVIYELMYEAQDPVLGGAGMAAIRDMVSLLRHGTDDDTLSAEIAALDLPEFEHTVSWGVSQSGRLLRLFLYQGFNEDLEGRPVFDGIMPVIAGAGFRMFNNRFAMPTRTNGQHENQFFPNDYFPFTYGDSTDPYSGRTDGILNKAHASNTEPKLMHIRTANEYWIRGGSLPHTDPLGTADAEIPDNVRFYAIGGSQHGSGSVRHVQRAPDSCLLTQTCGRPLRIRFCRLESSGLSKTRCLRPVVTPELPMTRWSIRTRNPARSIPRRGIRCRAMTIPRKCTRSPSLITVVAFVTKVSSISTH